MKSIAVIVLILIIKLEVLSQNQSFKFFDKTIKSGDYEVSLVVSNGKEALQKEISKKIFTYLENNGFRDKKNEYNFINYCDLNRGVVVGYMWTKDIFLDFNYYFTDKNGIVVKPRKCTIDIRESKKDDDIALFSKEMIAKSDKTEKSNCFDCYVWAITTIKEKDIKTYQFHYKNH